MSTTKLYTAEDLLKMPENTWYELIEGELVEVSPSSGKSSSVASTISFWIKGFVRERDLGYVTGEGGGFILRSKPGTVVAPDVGFVQKARYPEGLPARGYLDLRPDLAVEVVSPTDEPGDMRRKQRVYDQAGVPVVWWADPESRTVTIRKPGSEAITLKEHDDLDGDDLLPGFRIMVSELFED